VLLVPDHLRVEALLVQVADPVVPLVEPLRIDPVEAVHPRGDVVESGLHDEVEVVVEQAVRMDAPAETACRAGEEVEPAVSIGIVEDDRHPRDAANGEVVDTLGRERGTRQARHDETVEPEQLP
jgi:hypothetical protein